MTNDFVESRFNGLAVNVLGKVEENFVLAPCDPIECVSKESNVPDT
jgi:hypothetical protein